MEPRRIAGGRPPRGTCTSCGHKTSKALPKAITYQYYYSDVWHHESRHTGTAFPLLISPTCKICIFYKNTETDFVKSDHQGYWKKLNLLLTPFPRCVAKTFPRYLLSISRVAKKSKYHTMIGKACEENQIHIEWSVTWFFSSHKLYCAWQGWGTQPIDEFKKYPEHSSNS